MNTGRRGFEEGKEEIKWKEGKHTEGKYKSERDEEAFLRERKEQDNGRMCERG